MSSSVSPAAWLQAALVRSVHASAAPTTGGRHRAPEVPGAVDYLTSAQIAAGPGRHAAPERTSQVPDPEQDGTDGSGRPASRAAQA